MRDSVGLDPLPPNESGSTSCVVRWMVETESGWLGAWDRAAFDAFRNAIIEECAKACETEHANADPRLGYVQSYNAAISHGAATIRKLKAKLPE